MFKKLFLSNINQFWPQNKWIGMVNSFHVSANVFRGEDRRMMMKSLPSKDEGTSGERTIDIDNMIQLVKYNISYLNINVNVIV